MGRVERVSDSISLDEATELIQVGKERSAESKRPVVVSLTRPFPIEIDSIQLFHAGTRIDSTRNYWALPAEESWTVSVGEAAEISVKGPKRFQQAAAILRDLISSAIVEDNGGPGLVFSGGFRFNPGLPADDPWREFHDGLLTLPRWMVTSQSNGKRWVTINTVVNDHANVDSARKELADQATELFDSRTELAKDDEVLMKTEPTTDGWRRNVKEVLTAIKNEKLTKVTLARVMKLSAETPAPPEEVLRNLASNYPECRIFAFCRNQISFVGASPEELVNLRGEKVTSTCLAGSAPRGVSQKEDAEFSSWLLENAKERQEHAVVVEWIAQRMGSLCSKLQWDDVPHIVRLGNVQHLGTKFVGTPKTGCDILAFVEALHPTPAVGGIPLDPAMEMIGRLEDFDRGWYTGPVGWVDRFGNGEFAIAIRCALLRGNEAFLYAGAGIVSGSEPDREDHETTMKFKPLLTALGAT